MKTGDVLLVEDTSETAEIVRRAIEPEFRMHWVSNSEEAFRWLRSRQVDLVLIDIMLGTGTGFDLAEKMRGHSRLRDIPFVFLTARHEGEAKKQGFELGAEDFVTKPFDPTDLSLRIRSRVERHRRHLESREVIERGPLRIDVPLQRVTIEEGGQTVDLDLTPKEFKLLYLLIRNEPHTVHRNELLHYVWGDDVHVQARTIDTHIYTLRKRLRSMETCIISVAGIGYRFVSEC